MFSVVGPRREESEEYKRAQGGRVREYTVGKGAAEGGERSEREEVGPTVAAKKERGKRR